MAKRRSLQSLKAEDSRIKASIARQEQRLADLRKLQRQGVRKADRRKCYQIGETAFLAGIGEWELDDLHEAFLTLAKSKQRETDDEAWFADIQEQNERPLEVD